LSVEDKWLNRLLSSARVVVEHSIAGVKRCRIVKDVLRLTREGVSDMVMEIACSLHNLRVSSRHPLSLPTLDLFNLVAST
jgi:DDE superfamily endonuclease